MEDAGKKLVFIPGRYAQIYVAAVVSVFTIITTGIVLIILTAAGYSFGNVLLLCLLVAGIILTVIWLVFLLVVIFSKTKITVTEKGFSEVKKDSVMWEVDWEEVDKLRYCKIVWYGFLNPYNLGILLILTVFIGLAVLLGGDGAGFDLLFKIAQGGNLSIISTDDGTARIRRKKIILFPKSVKMLENEFGISVEYHRFNRKNEKKNEEKYGDDNN